MSKGQEHIEKAHTLAAEWFREHKARLYMLHADSTQEGFTVIEWRRQDHSNYAMQFTIMRNYVVVTGDVGDAIYCFGCELTLEKLASFDWAYFVGKCVASETGRDYTMKVPGIKHPVANVRAIGHFVGLKMAIKQLNSKPSDHPRPDETGAL